MDIQGAIRISAAAGAAFLTACAPAIRSQRDQAIPVPQGAAWAWAQDADTGIGPGGANAPAARPERRSSPDRGDPTALRAIPRRLFHRALETALEAKGFRKVDRPEDADFLLSLALEAARPGATRRGRAAVSIGIFGGRGRRGRYGRWGSYPGWGSFWPWGGWVWGPWGYGWPAMPYGGAMMMPYPVAVAPRGATVVALLRQRSDDEVAWRAEYRADAYDLAYLTQRHAQKIADKLVASLR
jgi:hypothetical protein